MCILDEMDKYSAAENLTQTVKQQNKEHHEYRQLRPHPPKGPPPAKKVIAESKCG